MPAWVIRDHSRMVFSGRGIGGGGNSGFQAINLAVRSGVSRIILLGYDMGFVDQPHWHGFHGDAMFNPDHQFLARCARILDAQAPALQSVGVEVLNASRVSALEAFSKVDLRGVL